MGVTGKTVPGRPWREYYDKKERAYREKKSQDYAKSKGFDVKRNKDGSGFSMMISKKIKGFESKEEDMGKKIIDEAEGIATVSTKGYSGSRVSKPEHRKGTKGFINFKGGKPAGDDDKKVLDYHRGEAAKQGKVVQLRYRGPRSHAGRQTYNPGASQIRGAATGAAVYYKDKSELGGRQRDAARKARREQNEEYEITYVDQKDEYEMNEDVEQNEGGEQETMEPLDVSDLILNAIEQKPLEFQQTFSDLMQQRIEDAVHQEKLAIAADFVGAAANTDPDEFDNDNEPEADDDWDGTEWDENEDGEEEDSDEETLNAEEENENG